MLHENTQHGAAGTRAQLHETLIRQGKCEHASNVCREIPANSFARQAVTKGAIFRELFFDPEGVEIP
ncbi:MAG: hypothetical protein ABSC92_03210, partial [Rhizomicrobium sp.]